MFLCLLLAVIWYSSTPAAGLQAALQTRNDARNVTQTLSNARPVVDAPASKPGGTLTIAPLVSFRAGALVTLFVAHKKTFLTLPAECTGKADVWFKPRPVLVLAMGKVGPRYLCTNSNSAGNLFVIVAEHVIDSTAYNCQPMSANSGCERTSFWWSVWYSWGSEMKSMGVTADDIRLNKLVWVSASKYAAMVRLFWRVFHNGTLPDEVIAVHSLHGHSIPFTRLRAPLMSRGGGAFGAPIWHMSNDPCVVDTLDILFRYKDIIARPCSPIVYDGSGFYVSYPDQLSSTVFANCDHTCGFRYYYGSSSRGQIVAYNSYESTLTSRNKIEGAVLDGR